VAAEAKMIIGGGGRTLPAMRISATAMLTVHDIRCVVDELRESSLEELRRLLDDYLRTHKAGDNTDADALATRVKNKTNMAKVAGLVRVAAKWGVITIIAAVIGSGVDHEMGELMGWTPPSITVVRQMSPSQLDELSHQIMQQLQHRRERHEPR